MKRQVLGAMVALTASLAFAGAAQAQSIGGSGVGIGGTIGGSVDVSGSHNSTFSIDNTNSITGSSGSGFDVTLKGTNGSAASFSGYGIAGTLTGLTSGPAGNLAVSVSGSDGSFAGTSDGAGKFNGEAMNFAQSSGTLTHSFTMDVTDKSSFDASAWGQLGGNAGGWTFNGVDGASS